MKRSGDGEAVPQPLPAAKRLKLQAMAAALRSKARMHITTPVLTASVSSAQASMLSSFDVVEPATHPPVASSSVLSGSTASTAVQISLPEAGTARLLASLPLPSAAPALCTADRACVSSSMVTSSMITVEVGVAQGDGDSDSEGSAVMGTPTLDPLHILSTQGSRSRAQTANASRSRSTTHRAQDPKPPSQLSPPPSTAPALTPLTQSLMPPAASARPAVSSWLCRTDLSEAAAAMQACAAAEAGAGPSSAAAADPLKEGLAESKKTAKKSKACFPYGNYHRYYGYRLNEAFDEDPRLRAFDAAWFHGKSVVDIGCNEGVLTLSLTCKFGCKSTLGVDIDPHLISKASRSLANLRTSLTQNVTHPELQAGPYARLRDARSSIKALKATKFAHMDFVNDTGGVKRADTILCLSVTKWVHFNWGDEGVKRLFARIKRILHPGGLFILEPQPWRSYRQVFKKQETLAALPFKNLSQFELRPEMFSDYLVKTHNFKLLHELNVGEQSAAKGFDRPLLVFQKQ